MSRLASTIMLFLLTSPLLAAMREEGAPSAPAETVGMVPIIIFAVIFIGSIVAFIVWYLMADEEKPEDRENKAK